MYPNDLKINYILIAIAFLSGACGSKYPTNTDLEKSSFVADCVSQVNESTFQESGLTLEADGDLYEAVLRIGNKILKDRYPDFPWPLRVRIVDTPTIINASTAGAGVLYVFSGAIRESRTEVELAGVIAHEIGHMVDQHPLKSVNQAIGFPKIKQFCSLLGIKFVTQPSNNTFAFNRTDTTTCTEDRELYKPFTEVPEDLRAELTEEELAQKLIDLNTLAFQRKNECLADEIGTLSLHDSQYDFRSLVSTFTLFDLLLDLSGADWRLVNHPLFSQRIDYLTEYLSTNSEFFSDHSENTGLDYQLFTEESFHSMISDHFGSDTEAKTDQAHGERWTETLPVDIDTLSKAIKKFNPKTGRDALIVKKILTLQGKKRLGH